MDSAGNKRTTSRQPVLRTARVRWSHSAVDCLVLDLSATGMRISNDTIMPYPETVTVELRTGGSWEAVRRWQRGMETGFEFTRFNGLHAEAIGEASALYSQLRGAGLIAVTARLQAARWFDHAGLQAAAQKAEEAVSALEEALRLACGRS